MSAPPAVHLTDHLVQLPGGPWSLWRCVCLRSAGFPARTVLCLAAPRSAKAAQSVLEAERKVEQAQIAALDELRQEFQKATGDCRKSLRKALRKLRRAKVPTHLPHPSLDRMRRAQERRGAAYSGFLQVADQDDIQIRATLQTAFRGDRFQEALLWQNRAAFHGGVKQWLCRPASEFRAKHKNSERLLAAYLQRYCVKNESIGFFGPIGWARLVAGGPAMTFRPGERLATACQTYMEGWCIDALASKLAQAHDLRPWLPPRPLPTFYLQGTRLHRPLIEAWLHARQGDTRVRNPRTSRAGELLDTIRPAIQLSPAELRLLRACDGVRTARDIARSLLDEPALGLSSEAEVYALLDRLCDLGALRWTLEVPLELHPERSLRQRLEQVEDKSLRESALADLAELEKARQAVARAAGDPRTLDGALGDLESTFARLAGLAPTRAAGQTYAGRTLVTLDCRRDVTLTLGPELSERLGPAASLLLQSARWFTYRVARRYRAALGAIYDQLALELRTPAVGFYAFALRALPLLRDPKAPPLMEVTQELQRRWAEILAPSPKESRLRHSSQKLAPGVRAAFDAPHAGWRLARYCSLDVMIAAASDRAIQQGNYQLVLGEVHISNALSLWCWVAQHPAPGELYQAREWDIPEPCVLPVPSKEQTTMRIAHALASPRDIWFEYEAQPSGQPRARTVSIAELLVERVEGELQVHTRDERHCFDLIEFLGHTLSNLCKAFPPLLPPAAHSPRITVDDVVLCREGWRFGAAELPFAQLTDRAELFLSARRWARRQGLPRCLFVHVPGELKPYYLDLESPLLIEIVAKHIRQSRIDAAPGATIHFTEMLPRLDQLWLTDAAGERYTSELRFVALDPATW